MTPDASAVPQTILEWVRRHRLRRRAQFGGEQAFRQYMRWLFRASRFVRYKGWKPAELAQALETVSKEPIHEPDAVDPSMVDGRHARPGTRGRRSRSPVSGRQCIDCGCLLPADRRRRGRCEPCRQRRARRTARQRMRQHRTKARIAEACQKPVEQRSGPRRGRQNQQRPPGRVKVPPSLRS